MKESEIRDILATNLYVLEDGLILQEKEQYIPNYLGTKGFIDIYAQDKKGNHVLIELKRSKPATRETLHEIIKYVEGVKVHFGARDDEIRVIVASTEWSELIVPYSRFLGMTTISVEGIKLTIDNKYNTISAEKVLPLEINEGRFIAPWYEVFWYKSFKNLSKGIETIKKAYSEKNIIDHIIAIFELKTPIPSIPYQKRKSALEAIFGPSQNSKLELYSYVVFCSSQIKTVEQYLEVLKNNNDRYEEAIYMIKDMSEEEKLCSLHELVSGLEPLPYSDDEEIGYPAKFDDYFNNKNFFLTNILKFGAFERNRLLTEDILITELKGLNGSLTSSGKISKNIYLSNVSHISSLKKEIENLLKDNNIWADRIIRNIGELQTKFPNAILDFKLFYPSTGIFTIYYTLSKGIDLGYLPEYFMKVSLDNKTRIYFGALDIFEYPLKFSDIIDKYYSYGIGELVNTATWGGYDNRDIDILEDLGLIYRNYRCDIEAEKLNFFIMKDGRWRNCEPLDPKENFYNYLNSNKELINEVMGELGIRDNNHFFEYDLPDDLVITILRKEIESNDFSRILRKLKCLLLSNNLTLKMRRKIEFAFDGYNEDIRELYEIVEVRNYVKKLSQDFPYLFYFIKIPGNYETLKVIANCYIVNDKEIKSNNRDNSLSLQFFLTQQFIGLNELTDRINLSIKDNKIMSEEVIKYLFPNQEQINNRIF